MGGKAEVGADGGGGLVGIAEEALGFLRLFGEDVIGEGDARLPLELGGEIGAAQKERFRHALRADGLGEVVAHVVGHVPGQLGGVAAQVKLLHLLGVLQDHAVLQVHDLAGVGEQLHPLDIAVGQGEGVVFPHAAPDGGPGGQGDGHDEGVSKLPELVGCDGASPHGGGGGHPALQGGGVAPAHQIHEGLLQGQGVVSLRGGGRLLVDPAGPPRLQGALQGFLLAAVDGHVGDGQPFSAVQKVVHGAQHLQQLLHR